MLLHGSVERDDSEVVAALWHGREACLRANARHWQAQVCAIEGGVVCTVSHLHPDLGKDPAHPCSCSCRYAHSHVYATRLIGLSSRTNTHTLLVCWCQSLKDVLLLYPCLMQAPGVMLVAQDVTQRLFSDTALFPDTCIQVVLQVRMRRRCLTGFACFPCVSLVLYVLCQSHVLSSEHGVLLSALRMNVHRTLVLVLIPLF
jgi:hypothetical protein